MMPRHGLDEYREALDRDPGELAALYQDFLIRVTEFFRDPTAFDVLREDVLLTVCEGRSPTEAIRIWVPGCATGEEVYSVAIAQVGRVADLVQSACDEFSGRAYGSRGPQCRYEATTSTDLSI